jgi:CubicO group peptidase (beta-lactamase class C family)
MKRTINLGIAHGDVPKRLGQHLALAAAGVRCPEDQSPWPLPKGEFAMTTPMRFATIAIASVLALLAACGAPASGPPTVARPTPAPPTAMPPSDAPAIELATPRPTEVARAPVSDAVVVKLVDDYVAALTKQDKFGGAVLIARDGKVVLNQGYGYADRAKSTPIETDTQFIVQGVVAWPMMAALALQLQDEGKLKLGESLCFYVKPCDDRFKPITLRQLLSNRAGLPDGRFVPDMDVNLGMPAARYFTRLAEIPPERFATPGESFQSVALPGGARVIADAGNWGALFQAIRGATNVQDVSNLWQQRFVTPLDLKTMGYYLYWHDTKFHRDAALGLSDITRTSFPMLMSAADVNTFAQALLGSKLLTTAQLNEMLRPMVKVDGAPGSMGYGLGVYSGTDSTGRSVVSQVDVGQGYGAYWAHYPGEKLTVVVLNHVTDWANQPYRARDVGLELARRIVEAK